ncbi:MAG: protein translocase subunit SecF [Rickettsiales bacterium]|nr:protein translocase subunit SecF [Rickettsiales bacterium]
MARFFPIRMIPDKTNIQFMRWRWVWFSLSIALTVATLALLFTRGLTLGIDFSGGILMDIRTQQAIEDLTPLRQAMDAGKFGEVSLQTFGDTQELLIRITADAKADQAAIVEKVKGIIAEKLGENVEFRQIDYVGPTVGQELIRGGTIATLLTFVGIMLYVWFRFEWQFGMGGIIALLHDAVLTIGFFVVTGFDFSLTSVAAIMTIVGYSINDSVVIYDRIRENMRKYKKMPMDELINLSINETLSRTVMTAGTTLLAALSLALFGGEVLKGFAWAMFFGVMAGTYSSIYISAPILIFFPVRPQEETETVASAVRG